MSSCYVESMLLMDHWYQLVFHKMLMLLSNYKLKQDPSQHQLLFSLSSSIFHNGFWFSSQYLNHTKWTKLLKHIFILFQHLSTFQHLNTSRSHLYAVYQWRMSVDDWYTNVVYAESFMTAVISQAVLILSVGKFCHCNTRFHKFQLKSFHIDLVLEIFYIHQCWLFGEVIFCFF